MTDKNDKFETRAISKGRMSDAHFGAVNTPIYRASTILYPSLEALEANGFIAPDVAFPALPAADAVPLGGAR